MLNRRIPEHMAFPVKERGVVLMVALIILVALTIAGIALIRSVDTTSIISGNLAFQQAAVHAGEAGSEDGIRTFLEASTPVARQSDDFAKAYSASTPAAGNPASWDAYWSATINPNPVSMPVAAKTCVDRVCTLPTDAAGNTVSYTIQRLCQIAGDPVLSPTGCASDEQQAALTGGSLASGSPQLTQVPKYYYRITSRVAGPRNTLSYVQTIVAR
jgi:type IV pilus assembly protein PilX